MPNFSYFCKTLKFYKIGYLMLSAILQFFLEKMKYCIPKDTVIYWETVDASQPNFSAFAKKVVNSIFLFIRYFLNYCFMKTFQLFPFAPIWLGKRFGNRSRLHYISSDPLVIHTTNKFNTKCLLKKTFEMVEI